MAVAQAAAPPEAAAVVPTAVPPEGAVAKAAAPREVAEPSDAAQPSDLQRSLGTGCTVEQFIKHIYPTTAVKLLRLLQGRLFDLDGLVFKSEGGGLADIQPLRISGDPNDGVRSFKEVLNLERCRVALGTTGLYEAAGSGFWFDIMHSWESAFGLADLHTTWDQLRVAESVYGEAAYRASAEDHTKRRYIVPGYFATSLETLSSLDKQIRSAGPQPPLGADPQVSFQGLPLYAGRALLYAWWVAVRAALDADDEFRVKKLVEALLTVTVRFRYAPSKDQVLLDAMGWSNAVKVQLGASVESIVEYIRMVVSLPAMAGNLCTVPKILKAAADVGLVWKGQPFTKPFATCILNVKDFVADPEFVAAHNALRELYPRLANEPTRLMRLAQTYAKLVTPDSPVTIAGMLGYALEAIRSVLLHGAVAEEELNAVFLFGASASPGFAQLLYRRCTFVVWFRAQVSHLTRGGAPAATMEEIATKVLPLFERPAIFDKEFYCATADGDPSTEHRDKKFAAYSDQALLTAAGKLAAKLLYDVHATAHDEGFQELAAAGTRYDEHFANLEGGGRKESTDLQAAYARFLAAMVAQPYAATDDPPFGRESAPAFLGGQMEGVLEDRDELWAKFQAFRRQTTNFHSARDAPQATAAVGGSMIEKLYARNGVLTNVLECANARKIAAVVGEAHIVYLVDAALFIDAAEKFVALPRVPDHNEHRPHALPRMTPELKLALAWMLTQRGEGTVHAAFDGRSRAVRRKLDAWQEEGWPTESHRADAWVIYTAPLRVRDLRLGGRKVAFADTLRETVYLGFSQPVTRLKSKDRGTITAAGEGTTHALSYTGVPLRPYAELPKLSKTAKEKVLGVAVPEYREKWAIQLANGQPLIFNDIKSIQFYASLFRDLDAAAVIDLSPGSGGAAIACLIAGITYEGVCYNNAHKAFLDTTVDRALVALLTEGLQSESGKATKDGKSAKDGKAGKDGLMYQGIPSEIAPQTLMKYFAATAAEGRRFVNAPAAEPEAENPDEDSDE